MKRSLVIGMASAGKTLFCTRFAEAMGVRDPEWLVERTDGRTESKRMGSSLKGENRDLTTASPTRFLHSMCMDLRWRGRRRRIVLTDSAGLTERFQETSTDRASMAQTLSMLLDADFILHVVDAHQIGCKAEGQRGKTSDGLSAVDRFIFSFAGQKQGYVVLANKMDLPGGRTGYKHLCSQFSKQRVIPVSALHGTGFREVKGYVCRMA